MRNSDLERFTLDIEALFTTFRADVTEAKLQAYWMAMQHVDIERADAAVSRAITECQFMPSPSELLILSGEMTPQDRAVRAWDSVRKAIGSHGAYSSVDFDDPLINAAIRNMGGWERLCRMTTEDFEVWGKKDFTKAYESFCRVGVSADACRALPGICERSNVDYSNHQLKARPVMCQLPQHRPNLIHGEEQKAIGEPVEIVAQLVAKVGK